MPPEQYLGNIPIASDTGRGSAPVLRLEVLRSPELPKSRVAYQGAAGSYSEMAALQYDPDAILIPCETFDDLFDAVLTGEATHGAVPIENSIAGSVERCHDLLGIHHEQGIRMVREVYQQVDINVYMVKTPKEHTISMADRVSLLRDVHAHPKLLEQAGEWSKKHGLTQVEAWDSAGALLNLVKSARSFETVMPVAVMASERAGEIARDLYQRGEAEYDIEIIATNVQDKEHNTTRFAIIQKNPELKNEADKTSLIFTLSHAPAALFVALAPFALRGIQLTRLIGRPIGDDPFNYLFYLDAESDLPKLQSAVTELEALTPDCEMLGYYTKGVRPDGFPKRTETVISNERIRELLRQYLERSEQDLARG